MKQPETYFQRRARKDMEKLKALQKSRDDKGGEVAQMVIDNHFFNNHKHIKNQKRRRRRPNKEAKAWMI